MSTTAARAKSIFLEAVEIHDCDERSRLLDDKCERNSELRRRVERLIRAHEMEDYLLDRTDVLRPDELSSGDRIGPYKIMETLGEGGMGVVFVADQERPLRRKVALKIIKPGMDSKQVLARFDAERQALALMDHPNIAKVLDAGSTEQGRPYFVMELIQGQSITDYCDEQKLSVGKRLMLFAQVCHAVQHAHQKGIIHRDLKPSNVLITEIDGHAVPKVIDFGVAKALSASLTEQTVYTSFQTLVGTPLYMSPEQAKLSGVDVDTRSDVYSLGVLLYELLTGTVPFDRDRLKQAALDEVCRIIREEEPPTPSQRLSTLGENASDISKNRATEPTQLARTLRNELTWIIGKAMDKDRDRRYPTALALADDVELHLADEPISAGKPSAWGRGRRYVRTHWRVLSVAALLLIFASISTGFAIRERRLVKSLIDELSSGALNAVFRGNRYEANEAIEKIEGTGAEEDLPQTLRGVALLLDGETDKAIEHLTNAAAQNPNSIKTQAALFWAYWQNGSYGKMDRIRDDLGDVTWPTDDYDKLFLAFVRQAAGKPSEAVPLDARISDLIERRPHWGIAYSLRSMNRMEIGMESKNLGDFENAIADLDDAMIRVPGSPFIQSQGLNTLTCAIELAEQQGRDCEHWLEKAKKIADDLARHDYLSSGGEHLAKFLYLVGDTEAAERLEQRLVDQGICESMPKWSQMLHQQDPNLEKELLGRRDDLDAQVSLAFLLAEKSADGRKEAMKIFNRLKAHDDLPMTYYMMAIEIPLLLGEPDLARELAKTVPDRARWVQWRWWDYTVLYYAGDMHEEEFLELADPFSNTGCIAHWAVAMNALARGERDKALANFQIVTEGQRVGWSPYHWSKVFVDRLQAPGSQWANWIDPDATKDK